MKIKPEDLEKAIKKEMDEYVEDAQDIVKSAVKEAGDKAQKQLKEKSPKDTGKYAKSWSVKTVKESTSEMDVVVYSKKQYRLTHLLENGHAKRGGGRVPAQVHIRPVEEDVTEELEKKIKEGLS